MNSIKAPFVCITCMGASCNLHKKEQWWEKTLMWWQEGLLTRLHADVAQDWIANNWDTWKVQIETSASCYSMMRIVSHYVTMYRLFDRFHGAGVWAAAVPQALGLLNNSILAVLPSIYVTHNLIHCYLKTAYDQVKSMYWIQFDSGLCPFCFAHLLWWFCILTVSG